MYNDGTGCAYNYGGYVGGYAPVTYQNTVTTGRSNSFALILVLFILLVVLGYCFLADRC